MDDAGSRAAAPIASASTTAQTPRPADAPKVQQPKPQALPSRSGPSSILVSPRQKGNPILNAVRSVAWEYSDIPADYVLGATTCALFLSLKYHRLHPEYVYNRIRDLKGQYQLRILLVMVDIENHEEALRELSKTSLINNVTVMLAWSAQEAGRYLELFKTFEHAAPTSIKAQQSSNYRDSLVDFITVPRSINKTDAVGLVSNFGSLRTAVNAGPEEVGLIAGWGEKKVQRWCNSVREPFRIKKAAKRGITRDNSRISLLRDTSRAEGEIPTVNDPSEDTANEMLDDAVPIAVDMAKTAPPALRPDADRRPSHRLAESNNADQSSETAEVLERQAEMDSRSRPKAGQEISRSGPQQSSAVASPEKKQGKEGMSEGIMAALDKLRQQ